MAPCLPSPPSRSWPSLLPAYFNPAFISRLIVRRESSDKPPSPPQRPSATGDSPSPPPTCRPLLTQSESKRSSIAPAAPPHSPWAWHTSFHRLWVGGP